MKKIEGAYRLEKVYMSPIRLFMEEVSKMKRQGYSVIDFTAGEPDFNTPEEIKQATIAAIEANKTHYAPNRGTVGVRAAIADMLKRTIHMDYDPEKEIIVTSGGAEAINNAFLAEINPGDEVIYFSPAFVSYENLIYMCGGMPTKIPLKSENGFQIDVDEVASHISEKTKMIVLNNTCNPTGAVFQTDALEQLAELAIKHDLLVFSDEIYNQITYDGVEFRSIASFPGMRERSIVMNGFSKAYAMTGWRVGIIASDEKIVSDILKVHQYTSTCVNTFVQEGIEKAMNKEATLQELAHMVGEFDRRRRILMDGLNRIGRLRYTVPKCAFYIFVDVSELGMSGDDFAQQLLHEHCVACIPGSKLGTECKDFVRISYATSEETLREGLARIEKFVNDKVD